MLVDPAKLVVLQYLDFPMRVSCILGFKSATIVIDIVNERTLLETVVP